MAERTQLSDEDRAILDAVWRELDEDDGGNAPGHGHSRVGIWDDDNGPILSGQPCAWCLTWAKFTKLIGRTTLDAKDAAGVSPCPKCGARGGGDWSRCNGSCPMAASPHHAHGVDQRVAAATDVRGRE